MSRDDRWNWAIAMAAGAQAPDIGVPMMLTQGTWFALPDVRGNVLVMGKARRDRVWRLALPSRAFNELFVPALESFLAAGAVI